MILLGEVARAIRAAAHGEVGAAFEQTVDDGFREVGIMQDIAQSRQRLVRREQHGPVPEIAFIDDVV